MSTIVNLRRVSSSKSCGIDMRRKHSPRPASESRCVTMLSPKRLIDVVMIR